MRTGTGRRFGSCRSYRRKPFGSGTGDPHNRLVDVPTGGLGGTDDFHDALVVARDHGGELVHHLRPALEQPLGDGRAGLREVLLHEGVQGLLLLVGQRGEVDQLRVDPLRVELQTNAVPPLMPAAKLRPVGPSTTTVPPVMYSQP